MKPLPETTRALTKGRPFFTHATPTPGYPLRCADGRTWAQVRADREAAEAQARAA